MACQRPGYSERVAIREGRYAEAAERNGEAEAITYFQLTRIVQQLNLPELTVSLNAGHAVLTNRGAELVQLEEQLTHEGPERRTLWRKRISQLQDESNSQRTALTRFAGRARSQQREQEEREEERRADPVVELAVEAGRVVQQAAAHAVPALVGGHA